MKIVDGNGAEKSEAATLSQYFRLPGQNTADFMKDMKGLTPEAKTELAHGAAAQLGYTVQP